MLRSSKRLVVLSIGLLLFSAGFADAQIVTITNTGYIAGPPPKADPQGTWSIPANSGTWRVKFEYDTVTNGVFTLDNTIGTGGTVNCTVNQSNGNWGPIGPETLINPLPAGAHIRAQLQRQNPNNQNQWITEHTAYAPIPPPTPAKED